VLREKKICEFVTCRFLIFTLILTLQTERKIIYVTIIIIIIAISKKQKKINAIEYIHIYIMDKVAKNLYIFSFSKCGSDFFVTKVGNLFF